MTTIIDPATLYPSGNQSITDDLYIEDKAGGYMLGQGAVPNVDPSTIGSATQLTWTGSTKTGHMLMYEAEHFVIDQLSLHGKPYQSAEQRKERGIYIHKGNVLGTGKLHVGKLVLTDFDVGIRIGELPNTLNTDVSTFEDLQIYDCGIAWQQVPSQSMMWRLNFYRGIGCPIHFDFESGGLFHLYAGEIDNGILARWLNTNWASGHTPQGGNQTYTFAGLRLGNGITTPQLAYCPELWRFCQLAVTYRNITIANPFYNGAPLITTLAAPAAPKGTDNRTRWVLDNVVGLQRDHIVASSGTSIKPVFTFRNCHCYNVLNLTQLFTASSAGQYVLVDGGGNTFEFIQPPGDTG